MFLGKTIKVETVEVKGYFTLKRDDGYYLQLDNTWSTFHSNGFIVTLKLFIYAETALAYWKENAPFDAKELTVGTKFRSNSDQNEYLVTDRGYAVCVHSDKYSTIGLTHALTCFSSHYKVI